MAMLAMVLVLVSSLLQQDLNQRRRDPVMGNDIAAPLENAPPVLAFTTVALGSFRGLIANALWIRATQLQDEGKFFEMVQLADWITKLEPHFAQVWVHMAWNMEYNISVRFSSPVDRWRWVQRGIELLRDDGIRLNPTEPLIYRELAWAYQNKIGYYLDDAHQYYKGAWFLEMNSVLANAATNVALLVNPPNDEYRRRAEIIRTKYKMDPAIMQEIESKYGRMEWRLPEPHAIYWGHVGLKASRGDPRNRSQLITLRRVIYQSLQALVFRGRVMSFTRDGRLQPVPDLDLIPVVYDTYEEMLRDEETPMRSSVESGFRSFLREAVYELYITNRRQEAEKWFQLFKGRFPDFLEGAASMEQFALQRLRVVLSDQNGERIRLVIMGLLQTGLSEEAMDRDEDAENYFAIAENLHGNYVGRFGRNARVPLPEFTEMVRDALCQLLNPQTGLLPNYSARLMTRRHISSLDEVCPKVTLPSDLSGVTNKVNSFLEVQPQPR
jgi:hypothetical protein